MMQEFLAMGGYARYVWPAYAITFSAVLLNIWLARRSLRNAQIEARRRLAVNGDPA
jgi:heme exporter protein CcmD